MNENERPQGMPFQMIAPLPWWVGERHPEQQVRPILGNEVPARVRFALEFLRYLAGKTAPVPVVTGFINGPGAIEVVDGQKLSSAENNAQASACNLLSEFFAGKYATNGWEEQYAAASEEAGKHGAFTIHCPACGGNKDKECLLCRGRGKLTTYPAEE